MLFVHAVLLANLSFPKHSANGGATLISPKNGFVDDYLYTLFNVSNTTNNTTTNSTATPSSTAGAQSSTTPAPSSTPSSKSNSPSAGAIAGGVIGGVAGLLLLAGLWLWYRRRQQSRALTPQELHDSSAPRNEYYGELPSDVKNAPDAQPPQELSSHSSVAYEMATPVNAVDGQLYSGNGGNELPMAPVAVVKREINS